MSHVTRFAFAALCLSAFLGMAPEPAKADPYRWCAEYSGRGGGGGRNCGFVTWQQCMATVSGIGGVCTPNPFFTGRPIVTPEDGVRVKRRQTTYYTY